MICFCFWMMWAIFFLRYIIKFNLFDWYAYVMIMNISNLLFIILLFFKYVLRDKICFSNQIYILSGPVQIAIPCTEGCFSRPKQMCEHREVFGRISRTDLLHELWRSIAKDIIIFWPWGYLNCGLFWQQIMLIKNITLRIDKQFSFETHSLWLQLLIWI